MRRRMPVHLLTLVATDLHSLALAATRPGFLASEFPLGFVQGFRVFCSIRACLAGWPPHSKIDRLERPNLHLEALVERFHMLQFRSLQLHGSANADEENRRLSPALN